jgi:hypothetical protein
MPKKSPPKNNSLETFVNKVWQAPANTGSSGTTGGRTRVTTLPTKLPSEYRIELIPTAPSSAKIAPLSPKVLNSSGTGYGSYRNK